MSVNSRFIQAHTDAIIEWIWDDNFTYDGNYSIIKDIKNNEIYFAFTDDNSNVINHNKVSNGLYSIDTLINKYGIIDTINKPFLQETKYVNNSLTKYNKVKIWFPIHYNFLDYNGMHLNVYTYNYDNTRTYNLLNYFLDINNQNALSLIDIESKPFRFNEKLWGKSITLYVPSIYDEALKRTSNAPTLGTLNYNITEGDLGLSTTSPIFMDFRYITNKSIILGETTYITNPSTVVSIPQAPEYNNLSVEIKQASDGDYFIINGLYNNNIGEFSTFMTMLEQSGKRSYILYSITVYEENIPQTTRDIYVYEDFLKGIDDYRPVLKYTNTTATIRVDMKVINSVDTSVITKSTEYAIVGNDVSKYGKYATPINISGAIKPKLYNSKPDTLVLPSKELINSHLKRKAPKQREVKYVPYPVLTNTYNIVAYNGNIKTTDQLYYGMGNLNLELKPFDNIMKIAIAKKSNTNTIEPFEIPSSNSIVQLVFKSNTTELRIPLYIESNEVNLAKGALVFKIPTSDLDVIKTFANKTFYLTLTSNGIETVLYNGTYFLQSEIIKNTVPVVTQQPITITQQEPINTTYKYAGIKAAAMNNKNALQFNSVRNFNNNDQFPADTNQTFTQLSDLSEVQLKRLL